MNRVSTCSNWYTIRRGLLRNYSNNTTQARDHCDMSAHKRPLRQKPSAKKLESFVSSADESESRESRRFRCEPLVSVDRYCRPETCRSKLSNSNHRSRSRERRSREGPLRSQRKRRSSPHTTRGNHANIAEPTGEDAGAPSLYTHC